MNETQKIILHKAMETDLKLRRHDAERMALALDLLGHKDLALEVKAISGHVAWADGNLAQAEAAAPKVPGFMDIEAPSHTPEVLEAESHVERYQAEWWEAKAKIDALAAELDRSIDWAAAYHEDQAARQAAVAAHRSKP